jgi:hypothetical protein
MYKHGKLGIFILYSDRIVDFENYADFKCNIKIKSVNEFNVKKSALKSLSMK